MKHLFSTFFIMILFVGIGKGLDAYENLTEYNKAVEYLDRKGEVYFKYVVDDLFKINDLTDVISIDNVKHNVVYAYANRKGFTNFLDHKLYYEVLPHPGDHPNPRMSGDPEEIKQDWDYYPTLQGYYDLMDGFANDHPDKCKIMQIGSSGMGRKLLYAIISDNIDSTEPEPRVVYTCAMHGDEIALYTNLLRLADYLLTKYDSDPFVKKLVDSTEIWICPLENPDGTFPRSETSISDAVRQTSNGVDLNRHYPNFEEGPHPDGENTYEPECQAVLDLIDEFQFVLGMNFHGGAQLLNYPYDSWRDLHEDDAWMQYVYRKYVNKVHEVNPGYMTEKNDGITNGYNWYEIHGSRMDWHTWGHFCREVTAEVSTDKNPPASSLPDYWDYHREPLLEYIEQALFGINGTVTCGSTGEGLRAKVFTINHDKDSSFTMAKLPHGDFWRPIYAGIYDVEFTCYGYQSDTVTDVQVKNDEATVLNVRLWPDGSGINNTQEIHKADIMITSHHIRFVKISFNGIYGKSTGAVFDLAGRLIKRIPQQAFSGKNIIIWDGTDNSGNLVSNGGYLIRIESDSRTLTKSFILSR